MNIYVFSFYVLEDWLFIQYFHGEKYTTQRHCHGKEKQSWISVRCEDGGEVRLDNCL